MAISHWFKNLFKASAWQGTVASDEQPLAPAGTVNEGLAIRREIVKNLTTATVMARESRFSPSFTVREVACRDSIGSLPTGEAKENATKAAHMMEDIRAYLGNRAITVNSWYRTPEYNRQVGGAKNSYHTKGMAVDFTVAGLTPKQVYAKLLKARSSGEIAIGGLGLYRGFVHADIGKVRTWKG